MVVLAPFFGAVGLFCDIFLAFSEILWWSSRRSTKMQKKTKTNHTIFHTLIEQAEILTEICW